MMHPLDNIKRFTFITGLALILSASTFLNNDDNAQQPVLDRFKKWVKEHPEERVYLSFDKSLYDPGETVWFTAFVRNATTLTADSISDILHVEVINPKGTVENHLKYILKDGVTNGNFSFTREMAGGIYKFKAYTLWQLNDSTQKIFEKEITLQKAITPNLIMKLDFKEKGYMPGQTAVADLELKSLANEPMRQHAYSYTIMLQGEKKLEQKGTTDNEGKAVIQYLLPTDLQTADGLLNVKIDFNGTTESIARSIPINIKNLQVEFYPEGGDLVAEVASNVAFAAVDEYGKPVNIEGAVYDKAGVLQTKFSSFHHGMGKFKLSAHTGDSYYATITGQGDKKFALPLINEEGIAMEVGAIVNNKVPVKLQGSTELKYMVTAQMRGKILYSDKVEMKDRVGQINIPVQNAGTGVLQVTVLNSMGNPVAERLVFVNKEKQMSLQITTNKDKYAPHEKVKVAVKARDENNKPIEGDICVSVVDDKVLSLANDKQGNILSRLLLEADITGDVLEPNFYFDKNEAKAAEALDLLMMTRGWRRMVWQHAVAKDTTQYTTRPEQTVIAGVVRNFKEGKPVRGAHVEVLGANESATTDKEGKFEIRGVDLSRVQTLAVRRPNKEIYYNVNEYGTNHDLNFTGGRSYTSSTRSSYRPSYNTVEKRALKVVKQPEVKYTVGTGKVKGIIVDENGEGLISASIYIDEGNNTGRIGTVTDFDGKFEISNAPQGKHNFKIAYLGYEFQTVSLDVFPTQDVTVKIFMSEKEMLLDVIVVTASKYESKMMEQSMSVEVISGSGKAASTIQRNNTIESQNISNLANVEISAYKVPLIDMMSSSANSTLVTRESIMPMPANTITEVLSTLKGVALTNQSIRGAREGSTVYFIDGIKVIGDPNISLDVIDQMRVYTGHVPARFGDATGGVVEITTRSGAPVSYYTYPETRVTVLNENIGRRYSVGRQFPTIIHKSTGAPGALYDNRKTIYWSGAIRLDGDGKANFDFYNGDELTTFRVTAEGMADNGLIGRGEKTYAVQAPLAVDAKLPLQAVSGDVLDIPVVVSNATDEAMTVDVKYNIPTSWSTLSELPATLQVAANSVSTVNVKVKAGLAIGRQAIGIDVKSGSYQKMFYKTVQVKGAGYPAEYFYSGNGTTQSFTYNLNDAVDSSLSSSLVIYPSSLSSLLDGAQGMLAMPHGCFEQVSSSTYPNIIVLQLLRQSGRNSSALEAKAKEYIKSGYDQLMKYEVVGGGFDLWGKGDANIPMTAYGLMEFVEMKRVHDGVSDAMIERTIKLLLSKKQGDHFDVGTKNSYFYGASNTETANAYIAWALTEAGVKDVDDVVDRLIQVLQSSKDGYQVALLANTLGNMNLFKQQHAMNAKLAGMQQSDGSWMVQNPSVTGSTGTALRIEATALALLALNKEGKTYAAQILKGMHYLLSNRSYGGRFGSTQSTILALKAIVSCMRGSSAQSWQSPVSISINGKVVRTTTISATSSEAYTAQGLQEYLKPGPNQIVVNFEKPDEYAAFTFGAKWQRYVPESSKEVKVELTTSLSANDVLVGDAVRLNVNLRNKENVPVPNPIAVIEIPSGLTLQAWQLKELKEKNVIDYYETFDNSVVLYFSELKANETKQIPIDLKTETKGEYKAAASVGYLYYTDEFKYWSAGNNITVR